MSFETVFKLCEKIRNKRNITYGGNWVYMSLESLLYGACYKCERARFTSDLNKKLDDVLDAINYLMFVAIRILNLKESGLNEEA